MLVSEDFFQFLFRPSKIAIQTTGRQQPFVTLHIPVAEINYYPQTDRHGRTDRSNLALPDVKSASHKNTDDRLFTTDDE